MTPLPTLIEVLLVALTVTAAVTDLKSRIIPNWLALAGLIAGFAANVYLSGLTGLKTAGLGMGLALLIYIPLFAIRAMGGGDVKLMAAAGSMIGAENWFSLFILTSILGALIAVIFLVARGRLGQTFSNIGHILKQGSRLKAPYQDRPDLEIGGKGSVSLPHGAVIAMGCFALLYLSRV